MAYGWHDDMYMVVVRHHKATNWQCYSLYNSLDEAQEGLRKTSKDSSYHYWLFKCTDITKEKFDEPIHSDGM